jgi:PPOX class probable F420-dependent enzyme
MTIPESHADILQKKKAFAQVATVGKGGAPQSSVVWFDWDGTAVTFSTTKGRAKYKHLERDPRISILIIDPDDPYRYLELRGAATMTEDPDGSLIQKLSLRYDDAPWTKSVEDRVIVSLDAEKVHAYGD